MKINKIAKKTIHYTFYALFFIVPLIFIPGHVELFQFNKMMTVYLATSIISSAWLIRMILQKQILIKRTPLDIPILLFLLSQIISTIFSIEPHTSIWGYYSRFHGGLLSTISYILLYYAFASNTFIATNNSNKPGNYRALSQLNANKGKLSPILKNSIFLLLLSSTIVVLYGILEHYGIDAHYWVQDVRNRVFSTLGQPNWLAAFLVSVTPLFFSIQYLTYKKPTTLLKAIRYTLYAIFYLTLLYTKSRSGLLGFSVMYLIFWSFTFIAFFKPSNNRRVLEGTKYFNFLRPGKLKASLAGLSKKKEFQSQPLESKKFSVPESARSPISAFIKNSVVIILLSLIIGTPFTPNLAQITKKIIKKPTPAPTVQTKPQIGTQLDIGGTESGEIRKIVWRGAINVWRNWPLFGSGVETFGYSYYNFRPIEHNFVSEWDFLYNKAHNEYLNFLSTTGAFGLGSYVLLQTWFVIWTIKQLFCLTGSLNSPERSSHLEHARRDVTSLAVVGHFSLLISLLAGYFGLAVTNFFGFSTVTTGLLFFMFPAFAVSVIHKDSNFNTKRKIMSLAKEEGKVESSKIGEKITPIQYLLILLILALSSVTLFQISKRWYTDRIFAQGKTLSRSAQISEALVLQQRAVALIPNEPLFRDRLALDLARSASALFQEGDLETAIVFAKTAKAHSDEVMKQNNVHLNYLKNRAATMLHLATTDPQYNQLALEALQRAQKLSPTDPKLPYNIGLYYQQQKQTEKAIQEFQNTLKLKPNYLEPRLALAKIYEDQDQEDKAHQHYEYILKHIDPNNPEATKALEIKKDESN